MEDLYKILKSFVFWEFLFGFEEGEEISLIAELKDKIDVICCFFDVDQSDNIVIFAALQHLDLVF